jgi:hypothetical protein
LKQNNILDEASLKELIHEYFTVSGDRYGKIDNTGLHIEYELDPNDELKKVFSIINEGTFSLKNYSSLKFNKTTYKYDTPSYHPVGLGDTTATKAIAGALIGLGYDHATIISATMAI